MGVIAGGSPAATSSGAAAPVTSDVSGSTLSVPNGSSVQEPKVLTVTGSRFQIAADIFNEYSTCNLLNIRLTSSAGTVTGWECSGVSNWAGGTSFVQQNSVQCGTAYSDVANKRIDTGVLGAGGNSVNVRMQFVIDVKFSASVTTTFTFYYAHNANGLVLARRFWSAQVLAP